MMKAFLITMMTVVGIMAGAFAQATPAIAAVDCSAEPMGEGCPCSLNSNSAVCKDLDTGRSDDGSGSSGFSGAMKNVTNTLFFAVGILAVIMIIVYVFDRLRAYKKWVLTIVNFVFRIPATSFYYH